MLDHACHSLENALNGYHQKNNSTKALAKRIRPRSSLQPLEEEAWSFRGFGSGVKEQGELEVEAFVKRIQKMEWDDRSEIIQSMIQTFNKVRAKRAGLRIRKDKTLSLATAGLRQTEAAVESLKKELESIHAKRAELQGQRKMERIKILQHSQEQAIQLEQQIEEMDEHIQDLSAAMVSAPPPEISVSGDIEKELEAARARLESAKSKCNEFDGQARAFEDLKKTACMSSKRLQDLTSQIKTARDTLAEEQKLLERSRKSNQLLSSCVSQILSRCSGGTSSSYHQSSGMATAFKILIENGGEMMVSDWKKELTLQLKLGSSAKAIQIVYGLVANSLVSIDRTQAEPRAFALLQ